MYDWDELKKSEDRAKWDQWVIRQNRKRLPLVNYTSAIVFACAAFLEAGGQMI